MTETVLFVGGSADGQWQTIGEDAREIRIPVPPLQRVDSYTWTCAVWQTYVRVAPHVYLISTESPDNLIPLLIEGYKRKESND